MTMTPFEEKKQFLIEKIKENVEKFGMYQFSTCDTNAYGREAIEHHAMHSICRNGIEGYHISFVTPHSVTRWTITLY